LRLDPAELGQLTIMLTVNKGEVKAIFQADNEVAASALSEQMSQLKATLEEQGLKVADLEVQTKLADDPSRQQWAGSDAFNREREMREQARMARLARLRQEAGEGLAQDMHNISKQEKIALTGLHIIA
jgi:flagellar hook-length control protein FliK